MQLLIAKIPLPILIKIFAMFVLLDHEQLMFKMEGVK